MVGRAADFGGETSSYGLFVWAFSYSCAIIPTELMSYSCKTPMDVWPAYSHSPVLTPVLLFLRTYRLFLWAFSCSCASIPMDLWPAYSHVPFLTPVLLFLWTYGLFLWTFFFSCATIPTDPWPISLDLWPIPMALRQTLMNPTTGHGFIQYICAIPCFVTPVSWQINTLIGVFLRYSM